MSAKTPKFAERLKPPRRITEQPRRSAPVRVPKKAGA